MPCPLSPLCGGACGRFGWPRPAHCVLQRYVWYGYCRLLAVMSSLRARYHTKLLFSPCKRCPCPCSDAVLSPSSPPSGLRGFVPVVRDRWEQGRFGGPPGGGGGDTMGGGGGGAPPPLPQATPLVPANSHNCPPKLGLAPRPTGGSGSTWNHRAPSPSPPLRHTDDNDGDDVVHNDVDVLFPVWLLVVPFLLCCSGLRQRMFIA